MIDIISCYQWLRDSMCGWLGQVVALAGLSLSIAMLLPTRQLMWWLRRIPLILALRLFIRHLSHTG